MANYLDRGNLSEDTHQSLVLYVQHGVQPGGFLTAVLRNDLHAAVARADNDNLKALVDVVRWLHNHVPSACWGSVDHVVCWRGLDESRKP